VGPRKQYRWTPTSFIHPPPYPVFFTLLKKPLASWLPKEFSVLSFFCLSQYAMFLEDKAERERERNLKEIYRVRFLMTNQDHAL
jgi:hypothetical protein